MSSAIYGGTGATPSALSHDGAQVVKFDATGIDSGLNVGASVASSAITVTLAQCGLRFRNTTLSNGTPAYVGTNTAISLVVPSTATLGTISAQQSRLVVLALNNAGTMELAVVNIAGGNDLSETGLINTTAIAAASNAANVIYSTTARTGVAYRVVGYVESTQATAGTWSTAPSTVQGYGGQALAAMSSLGYGQTWQNVFGSRASGVTYYNTTGKPITIVVASTATCTFTVVINGVSRNWQVSSQGSMSFVIPPSQSYNVTFSAGYSGWDELR